MNPTVLLVSLGALGAWLILRKGEPRSEIPQLGPAQKTAVATTSVLGAPQHLQISSVPARAPTQNDSPSANAQYYVQHLENAARNVELIAGGAETHDQSVLVNQAYSDLSLPIDVLTTQKDLNVLGAVPPLVEDGVLGPKTRDAIDSFQAHADLPRSGVMDAATSHALRRAIVFVLSPQGAAS